MTIRSLINSEAIRLVLFMFYVQAYICVKLSRLFERCLASLLSLPNRYLSCLAMFSKISDSKGNVVKIMQAVCEHGDISNKLKIFLMFYYEMFDDDNTGFNFDKLQKIISCSMLYCSYIVINKNTDETLTASVEKLKNLYIITHNTNGKKSATVYVDGIDTNVTFGEVRF